MAVTTYYTLSISGVLGQPYDAGSRVRDEWTALFGDQPTAGTDQDLGWPAGFLRPSVSVPPRKLTGAGNQDYNLGGGWTIEDWEPGFEPAAHGSQTKLTFVAKVEFSGHGGIDDHKDSQMLAAVWFFEHASKQWHQTLKSKLIAFNNNHKDMVAPAWFQEFEFYCGNGGGGGE